MTPLVRLAPGELQCVAYPFRHLATDQRLLDDIARTVFHYLDGFVNLARKSTNNEYGHPESGSVMVAMLLSNLAQKGLAVFDVTFDRVRRAFYLQIQQNQTERLILKLG